MAGRLGLVVAIAAGFGLAGCGGAAARAAHPAGPPSSCGSAAVCERDCSGGNVAACVRFAGRHVLTGDGVPPDPARAAALYRSACDAGDGDGCVGLATAYELGRGIAADPAAAARLQRRASDLFQAGCDAGHAAACSAAALVHEEGRLGERDDARALALYRRACALGDGDGCYFEAILLEDGRGGVGFDLDGAERIYTQRCESGDPDACAAAAGMREDYGVLPRDPKRASALRHREASLREARCRGGDGNECTVAAWLFDAEAGLRDPDRLGEMARRGCELGEIGSCAEQATWLETSRNDKAAALPLWKRACDAGRESACTALADRLDAAGDRAGAAAARARTHALREESCTQRGSAYGCQTLAAEAAAGSDGVAADPARAATLWARAIALRQRGCARSASYDCDALAELLDQGTGIAADPAAATRYLTISCDLGSELACERLGHRYEVGKGARRDPARALGLFQRACAAGASGACWRVYETLSADDSESVGHADRAEAARQRACDLGAFECKTPDNPELQDGDSEPCQDEYNEQEGDGLDDAQTGE